MTATRKLHDVKLMEKSVHFLSNKPLTSAGKSLLQKDSKVAIPPSFTPVTNHITATKHISDSLGENNLFHKIDSMEYYAKVKDVLTKFTAKPIPIVSNITKDEKETLHNCRKITAIWFLLQIKVLPWLS